MPGYGYVPFAPTGPYDPSSPEGLELILQRGDIEASGAAARGQNWAQLIGALGQAAARSYAQWDLSRGQGGGMPTGGGGGGASQPPALSAFGNRSNAEQMEMLRDVYGW